MLGKFTQVALQQQISCSSRYCCYFLAVEVGRPPYDRDVRADLIHIIVIITVFSEALLSCWATCAAMFAAPALSVAAFCNRQHSALLTRLVRARAGCRRNEQHLVSTDVQQSTDGPTQGLKMLASSPQLASASLR